jgi:hypothetical protein
MVLGFLGFPVLLPAERNSLRYALSSFGAEVAHFAAGNKQSGFLQDGDFGVNLCQDTFPAESRLVCNCHLSSSYRKFLQCEA